MKRTSKTYGKYSLKKLLTFDKIWCYNKSPPRMAMEQRFKRNKKKLKKCLTGRTTCDKISTVAAEKAAHRTLTNKQ